MEQYEAMAELTARAGLSGTEARRWLRDARANAGVQQRFTAPDGRDVMITYTAVVRRDSPREDYSVHLGPGIVKE